MGELRDDPKFRAWADERKRTVLTMLDDSSVAAAVLSPPFTLERLDVQQALEIGAALLLGKPLILCVSAGTQCPAGLAAAAARVVEIDEPLGSPSNAERIRAAVEAVSP